MSHSVKKFSPEVRPATVRLLLEHEGENPSYWTVWYRLLARLAVRGIRWTNGSRRRRSRAISGPAFFLRLQINLSAYYEQLRRRRAIKDEDQSRNSIMLRWSRKFCGFLGAFLHLRRVQGLRQFLKAYRHLAYDAIRPVFIWSLIFFSVFWRCVDVPIWSERWSVRADKGSSPGSGRSCRRDICG